MAAHPHAHLDDDDDFGGDFPGSRVSKSSGSKRSYGELDDDEDDIFGSKKGNTKVEETGMILSLRESLQECKEALATSRLELEVAKAEIQKWHTSFRNEPFIPTGKAPDPNMVTNYLQALKSSKDSLEEQLEKAKKKEAAFIVTFAKREQEISELKAAVRDLKVQLKPPSMQARRLLLDPAVHEEFTRLKNLVEERDKKVKELQDSIAAVNFTPQSKMGRLLMLKCKTLQDENEELGNQASEGKIQELTMSLALQKYQNQELRSQFQALYKQMEGLTNDAERSNEMVLILEEKVEERGDEIRKLRQQQKGWEVGDDRIDVGSEEKVQDEDEDEDEEALPGEVKAEVPA